MGKTIHILNGDSIVPILEKSEIKGDVVVWREVLCEGPLELKVASDEFWKKRYTFFENEVEVQRVDYFNKTIQELIKLEDLTSYNEIVLWFEFDLFCQVNLLAACSYLLQNYDKEANYFLVCTGKEKGKKELQSLSNYSSDEFNTLYKYKTTLSKTSLLFAQKCWEIYVENDLEKLKTFDFSQNSKFEYLQLAMNQHLKRFPKENGLNEIENKILEIINSEVLTDREIVRKLLIWQQKETVYGFGDLQYFSYLKGLNNYFEIINSNYYLNAKAIEKFIN